jgi:hypothetical protein
MDDERFQQIEKRLNEQAEATRALNETLNKFIAIMGNQEMARNISPPPPVSTPLVITPLQASQPSRVKLGVPSHFDGDRAQGCTFLTSCELYILLTASDFIDEQVHIHWALSYFKGSDTPQAPYPRVDQSQAEAFRRISDKLCRMPTRRLFAHAKSTTLYSPFLS